MSTTIWLVILYIFILFLFCCFALQLAKNWGSDVRLVSYLAALSGIVAYIVASIASDLGAIDTSGKFAGSMGKHLNALLHLVLDLSTDLKLVGAAVAIVLLPQLISYVVSGLFGCAHKPLFTGLTLRVAFWLSVKPFVIVGGVMLALAAFGNIHNWAGMTLVKSAALGWLGLALIVVALVYIYFYRDIPSMVSSSLRSFGWFKRVGDWFSRTENKSE